jgi:4-hydroxyphenylacetate 3-monooxygenase
MAARTGAQFLAGLRADREVWVDGERIVDVVEHPATSGAALALAEVFDLQHVHADVCLVPDPETGEPINLSHLIPRSLDDLHRRGRALRTIAEYSVGLMGRTPDYMNVTYAGFAGRAEEWAVKGNEAGAERLVAYQKTLRREDLSLTHTLVQPTVDRALGDVPKAGNDISLRKVGETAHGIIVFRPLHPLPMKLPYTPAYPCQRVLTITRCRSAYRWARLV